MKWLEVNTEVEADPMLGVIRLCVLWYHPFGHSLDT